MNNSGGQQVNFPYGEMTFDPIGSFVGLSESQPIDVPSPFTFVMGQFMEASTGKCYADYVETRCEVVQKMLNNGTGAPAPLDPYTTDSNNRLNRITYDWDNGFYGFVPVGARRSQSGRSWYDPYTQTEGTLRNDLLPFSFGAGFGITSAPQDRAQQPATPPDTRTDCQRFVDMVQGIANRSATHKEFMDEMARTFTAGDDSSIYELIRTNDMPARTRFTAGGFKQEFVDTSNQVRHFTAGLIAGYNLGATAGLIAMNTNEHGNNPADSRADYALNRVSTRLGAEEIVPNSAYTTGGNIRGERYKVKHPARQGYRTLANIIRSQVCQ